jgi:hypothetical protein
MDRLPSWQAIPPAVISLVAAVLSGRAHPVERTRHFDERHETVSS